MLLSAGEFAPRPDNFGGLGLEAHLTAMSLMGYDAVTLGHRELAIDPKILDDQLAINRTPVVCSNLFFDGAPYGQKYVLLHRGPLTIGVVSAIDPTRRASQDPEVGSHWTFPEAESSLRSVIEEAESSANILILLSQMGLWKTLDLIDQFSQIDVAIVGDEGKTIRNPILYRNSLVIMSGNRGQYVGKLDLILDGDGGILGYQGDLIPLDETIPDDPEIAALVAEFKNRVEELAVDTTAATADTSGTLENVPGRYVGATVCQECHSWIYTKWQVTPHRHAFQTLHRERQSSNPDCVPCHVVGYGQGGYTNLDETPHLVDVQCESCHDRGSNHAENPQVVMRSAISETTCLRCHCGRWGEDFDFPTAIKSVH